MQFLNLNLKIEEQEGFKITTILDNGGIQEYHERVNYEMKKLLMLGVLHC